MRQLYVCSESIWSRYPENYLIGIISEENDQYRFEYKLGGEFPKQYLRIQEFPDADKSYGDKEASNFVKRLIPRRNGPFIARALEKSCLTEYDEWELLKFYGSRNEQQDCFIYETLPEKSIVIEKLN